MKKALIVWGGWDGHTPKESTAVFAPLLEAAGFAVDLREGLDAYNDAELLASQDLIVQCVTMSEITGEQWKNLSAAVRGGVGFAGWHGGIIDSFRSNTEYQWMTGAQWVAHPGNCIPSYTVELESTHEITAGLNDFELTNTEQYYMHCDPAIQVLCSTEFSGEHGDQDLYPAKVVMPYAWTRQWGAGRVFVACWGHTFKDFEVPEAKEIVRRGLIWASK